MSYEVCTWINDGVAGRIRLQNKPTTLSLKSKNLQKIREDAESIEYINPDYCMFKLEADGYVTFFSSHLFIRKNVNFIIRTLQENGLYASSVSE